ncbi:hypothetical protein CRUP_028628, partial [Coryphaenoides rupestris]
YCLLPYWYTVFHQAHSSALPVLRPLWVEFPEDPNTFAVDNEYLIGTPVPEGRDCGYQDNEMRFLHRRPPAGVAVGDVYLDDGHTFSSSGGQGEFDCGHVIQTVIILGRKSAPSSVTLHVAGEEDRGVTIATV